MGDHDLAEKYQIHIVKTGFPALIAIALAGQNCKYGRKEFSLIFH
jgi:hypothetical protein